MFKGEQKNLIVKFKSVSKTDFLERLSNYLVLSFVGNNLDGYASGISDVQGIPMH